MLALSSLVALKDYDENGDVKKALSEEIFREWKDRFGSSYVTDQELRKVVMSTNETAKKQREAVSQMKAVTDMLKQEAVLSKDLKRIVSPLAKQEDLDRIE